MPRIIPLPISVSILCVPTRVGLLPLFVWHCSVSRAGREDAQGLALLCRRESDSRGF